MTNKFRVWVTVEEVDENGLPIRELDLSFSSIDGFQSEEQAVDFVYKVQDIGEEFVAMPPETHSSIVCRYRF